MFKLLIKSMLLIILLLGVSKMVAAENMKKFADLEVHYIGLSTSILQPDIAKNYGIERSRYRGFVNISVLDSSKDGKPAVSVGISGTATNLLGQPIPLDFMEVKEGSAIYYIAQVKYPNDEFFRFNILINNNGKEHTLKFEQKFYVEQ
ncbi:DUF4426 domain-containing protein [Thalassotalea sp. ND16A]|uniref:DUF4426 domain-containing protein n=1 Tax=Thalassotalea sp. ND16A TaxID=1535422 RepID=UPI00051A8798|nr:DUF4426 domain-containing protein [Thalassotalea sp. ND16A]KGK00655.1 hypothetical protein ND16A_3415 [Thalassotalea sp. ND16A]